MNWSCTAATEPARISAERALAAGLGLTSARLSPLAGGNNARIYLARQEGQPPVVVKCHHQARRHGRDGLRAEFQGLDFLWRNGLRSVPRPLHLDPEHGCLLLEWRAGHPLAMGVVGPDEVGQAVDFLARLAELARLPESRELPRASEACFSLAELEENLAGRLANLAAQFGRGGEYAELEAFLTREWEPAWREMEAWAAERLAALGWGEQTFLPPERRILSPSDFGFHNALRADDGGLVFLDFEHFGWDDPAKTISDFLLHPAMGLNRDLGRLFSQRLLERLAEDGHLAPRLEALFPLYGLKWCLILLNEFLASDLERRGFAQGADLDASSLRRRQLDKARAMLRRVRDEYRAFPYGARKEGDMNLANHQPTSPTADDSTRSRALRRVIAQTMIAGGRGHLASAFSLVEVMQVLYDEVLRYDPANPDWPLRDRCILSKGHGCLVQYALLADKGFFPKTCLDEFCAFQGILGGHPDQAKVPGVEASTGSLGHGLSIGIGFALNARHKRQDYRTFVILGDGESNEGSVWEGAMCAGKHGLDNLVVLTDYNKHQSCGPTREIMDLEPLADKWRAFGFAVAEVDGHDLEQIRAVLGRLPLEPGKPSSIICHTVKGKGVSYIENNLEWHHKSKLAPAAVQDLLGQLGA